MFMNVKRIPISVRMEVSVSTWWVDTCAAVIMDGLAPIVKTVGDQFFF